MKYDYVKLNPSEQIGPHSQPSWELSYILRGRGTKSVGDTESPFREGDMVLVVPEMRHCWRFEDEDGDEIENITLMISRKFLSQAAVLPGFEPVVAGIIGMQDSLEFHGASKAALARLLLQMENESQAERTASVLRILSLISRERDVSVSGRFRKAETAVEKIRKMEIYVTCNCRRHLTLEDAARHAGMSRTRFCSFWRHETGETFMTFVTRQRLKTACHLLLTRPGMHVSEICYESGFSDITARTGSRGKSGRVDLLAECYAACGHKHPSQATIACSWTIWPSGGATLSANCCGRFVACCAIFAADTTKNVYTLFVTTICVITFYVLYSSHKSKSERYGNTVHIWKDCHREELYRPREGNRQPGSELHVVNQHDYHIPAPMGEKFACK